MSLIGGGKRSQNVGGGNFEMSKTVSRRAENQTSLLYGRQMMRDSDLTGAKFTLRGEGQKWLKTGWVCILAPAPSWLMRKVPSGEGAAKVSVI